MKNKLSDTADYDTSILRNTKFQVDLNDPNIREALRNIDNNLIKIGPDDIIPPLSETPPTQFDVSYERISDEEMEELLKRFK